jgi:hypothetical protein
MFDTGHFTLQTDGDEIARLLREFLSEQVTKS